MLTKRSFSLAGHRTSVALEDAFWRALAAIAARRNTNLSALVAQIDRARAPETSLASALRVLALNDAHDFVATEKSPHHCAGH
jgi:predicted DNA-binding ribbon-helix-helix protein